MPKKREEREIERWITVNGARVPIFKGQSVEEAVKEHISKDRSKQDGKKTSDKGKTDSFTRTAEGMSNLQNAKENVEGLKEQLKKHPEHADEIKKRLKAAQDHYKKLSKGDTSDDNFKTAAEWDKAEKKAAEKKAASKTENQRREDELKKQLKSLGGKEFDKDARVVIDDIRARLDEHRRFEGDREDMDARLKELKKKEAQITKTNAFNPEARKTLKDLRSRIDEINKLKQNDAHEIPAKKSGSDDGYPSEQEMRDYIKSKGKEKFVKELSGNTERGYQAALRNVYDQETLSPEEYGKKYFGKDYQYKGDKTAAKTAKTIADNESIKEKQLAANKVEASKAGGKSVFGKEVEDKIGAYRDKFLKHRTDDQLNDLEKNINASSKIVGTTENDHVALAAIRKERESRQAGKQATTEAKTYTKQDIPKGISAADREEISDLFKKGSGAWAYTEAMERAINKPLDGKKTSTEKSLRRNFESTLRGFEDTEYVVDDGPAKDFMRGMIADYKKRFEDNMSRRKNGSKSAVSKESAGAMSNVYDGGKKDTSSGEKSKSAAYQNRLSTMNVNQLRDLAVSLGADRKRLYGTSKNAMIVIINRLRSSK